MGSKSVQNYCNAEKVRKYFAGIWRRAEDVVNFSGFSVYGVCNKKMPHHGSGSSPYHDAAKCYVALQAYALVGHA